MDPALIAVIGTLGGVVITAGAGVITTQATGRNQRELTRAQLAHDEAKSLRQERRASFVEFLEAYDQVFRKAQTQMADADSDPTSTFQNAAKAEMHRLTRAYLVVTITAGAAVRTTAGDALRTMWQLGDAVAAADQKKFKRAIGQARAPRHRVRAAMRAELDVEETPS